MSPGLDILDLAGLAPRLGEVALRDLEGAALLLDSMLQDADRRHAERMEIAHKRESTTARRTKPTVVLRAVGAQRERLRINAHRAAKL